MKVECEKLVKDYEYWECVEKEKDCGNDLDG